ncbi:MAG TPA: chemotaxis protein CheB [bacterium]|mgnify:CR=1 FL=1|nr:chemotaxis protein CheB [bacterium]
MSTGLKLRVVTDKEVVYRLINRSLTNHDDISLLEGSLDFTQVAGLTPTDLPDVFLVSMQDKKQEMASVIRIAHQLERPVFVYTDLLDDPKYSAYLKKAGAFEVLEKTTPGKTQGDGYFRHLGTKLASVTRSAHTVWRQREKSRETGTAARPQVSKLPVTGIAARVAVAVCLDGDDPQQLIKLIGGLKRLEGIVLLICHRFPGEKIKATFELLNAEIPYHLVRASTGLQMNENTAVIAPPLHPLTAGANHKVVVGEEIDQQTKTDFSQLVRSVAKEYGARSVGVMLGQDAAFACESLNEVADGGTAIFVQLPDNQPGSPSSGNLRMLAGAMLPFALRRHLEKLLA